MKRPNYEAHALFRRTPVRRAQIPGTNVDYPPNTFGLSDKLRLLKQTLKLKHELENHMKSWKTTLGGILAGLGPVSKNMLPDAWDWIGDALLSIGSLLIGMAARDNKVTSEDAGAK